MLTNTRVMPGRALARGQVGDDWLTDLCSRGLKRVGQMWCALRGHNVLLRIETRRMSLECAHCGYESPGWDLGSVSRPRSAPEALLPVAAGGRRPPAVSHG